MRGTRRGLVCLFARTFVSQKSQAHIFMRPVCSGCGTESEALLCQQMPHLSRSYPLHRSQRPFLGLTAPLEVGILAHGGMLAP
jgi:hypothetical protein